MNIITNISVSTCRCERFPRSNTALALGASVSLPQNGLDHKGLLRL